DKGRCVGATGPQDKETSLAARRSRSDCPGIAVLSCGFLQLHYQPHRAIQRGQRLFLTGLRVKSRLLLQFAVYALPEGSYRFSGAPSLYGSRRASVMKKETGALNID